MGQFSFIQLENERAGLLFMRICLAFALLILSAFPARSQSLWDHNGSTVKLMAEGNSRKFYYEKPREGLDVKSGTLLFSGTKEGSRYSGTVYIFSTKCGVTSYDVSGTVADDQLSVTMYGQAPRRNEHCGVVGQREEVIRFSFLSSKSNTGSSSLSRRRYNYRHTEHPIITGMLCVETSERRIQEIVLAAQRHSATIKRSSERDNHCYDGGLALDVPEGLEGWLAENLRESGYRVKQGGGTAGGSGNIAFFMKPEQVLSERPTPQNFAAVKKDVSCRIKERFEKYFGEINPRACPNVSFPDGLCWKLTLSGHTSTSAGLNPVKLNQRISDKYWFRTNVELWMGYFPRYFDLDDKDLGPKVKVHLSVISSEFARSPTNRAPSQYRTIDQFESISNDELDEEFNERLAEIFQESPLTCSLKQ
jgi:hypothetical protein